ncbi:putative baseplate wedge protein [Rhizobium phage RHph_I46]|uniref:Putative baseplate wedge protein n=1 Tax=Rhizobium phage RHph_I1_9 TaxID=2509729 RepID=A0A7S5RIL8_9CAUD|nr:baseplate wedge subunit [Rhizobium phage RHph_I1_9]QIG69697.1 putative baseplate wedge protein [Rhizobium phage RHph_I46]QIG70978.1 putative baseplate wedge protein [Rhizobium phage RHph_I9]QIG73564.1 putative baseplate wedge protein [Rhizobium phage RHph_I1_9]QIG76317.1 putative baseplate wedge protein [Rhizobium phage RHph_I34]
MFFKAYPYTDFSFDGKTFNLEDLTRRVIFEPKTFSNYSYIYEIDVSDTRPDVASQLLYQNVNYWWTFFIVNGITINDWPLSDGELEDFLTSKYTEFQLQQTYGYFDDNGAQVPSFGFANFNADGKTINYAVNRDDFAITSSNMFKSKHNRMSLREYLTDQNEKRKKIRAVRADFIGRFFDDFRNRIKNEVDLGI